MYTLNSEIGSGVDTVSLGNRLQRGRRYSKNRFRRGYRYSRKSAPAWTPIFQEIGSSVDADILGLSVPAWIPKPKIISALGWASEVQKSKDSFGTRVGFRSTEIQRFVGSRVTSEEWKNGKNQVSWEGLPSSEERKKIKIRSVDFRIPKIRKEPRFVDFRRIDEPRFVRLSVGLWIYGFRFMDFGYMGFDFRLGFGYMGFDFRLGFGYMGFDFRLGFGYMGSTFGWTLDIWILTFGSWALDRYQLRSMVDNG
ncbi:unnamed protein product [Rhizophagus irregularis]|nr:unnamed protein product [Rhizophagus irregularis]